MRVFFQFFSDTKMTCTFKSTLFHFISILFPYLSCSSNTFLCKIVYRTPLNSCLNHQLIRGIRKNAVWLLNLPWGWTWDYCCLLVILEGSEMERQLSKSQRSFQTCPSVYHSFLDCTKPIRGSGTDINPAATRRGCGLQRQPSSWKWSGLPRQGTRASCLWCIWRKQ